MQANPSATPLIKLHNVLKRYHTASGPFTALNNISLTINEGEFVAILGKSGSGKSTLLNLLGGIDRANSGTIEIAGQQLDNLSERLLAQWRGNTVGIVFQFFQLLPTLNALENVMLAMDFCQKIPSSQRASRALALLEQVGVSNQAYKLPATMSGGQQQRVAIARALANQPALIIADEPTGNLDSSNAALVLQVLHQLSKTKHNNKPSTIVIATHDEEIARLADRTLYVVDGKLIERSSTQPTMARITEEVCA